ncbi:MAG: tryptophan-rich sensory protein [Parachlamydiaceae bacterium]|nr:tryptophan-rich sensory protein [Parachlamydiaceae bacterium]
MDILSNQKWRWLLFFLFLCFSIEIIGGWLTQTSVSSWYPTLKKPSWNPPNWIFGPVWTLLYGLMAFSVWLIWLKQQEGDLRKNFTPAYFLFGLQLFLNCLWSGLFFWMQNPAIALIDILLLWIVLLFTILEFKKHSIMAALLLVPYFLWITYAVSLNSAIWVLNQ